MGIEECIQYIIEWYFSDSIELLDEVLNDDVEDPQYSAITTLNRLWVYLQLKANKNCECSNVYSLLKKIGYTAEDIALFKKKVQEEQKIYRGDVLDTEFF